MGNETHNPCFVNYNWYKLHIHKVLTDFVSILLPNWVGLMKIEDVFYSQYSEAWIKTGLEKCLSYQKSFCFLCIFTCLNRSGYQIKKKISGLLFLLKNPTHIYAHGRSYYSEKKKIIIFSNLNTLYPSGK